MQAVGKKKQMWIPYPSAKKEEKLETYPPGNYLDVPGS